jgi:hypothetical protein
MMSLLIILPSESALLATRRLDDKADNKTVMHALDSDVFHYLCSYTDWSTGVIGRRSRLSYYRIASSLTEDIPRKSSRRLRTVNRNDVRNSVKRLVRVGLFINESLAEEKHFALILRRPFWQALFTIDSATNNPDTRQMSGFMSELLKRSAFNSNVLAKRTTNNSDDNYATDATYKSSIYRTNANSTKFQLSLTWQYDDDLVDLFLQAAGFSISQIKQIWFGKYVQYWSGEAVERTQREWSRHFANHMQSYLLRPDFFEQVNGMLEDDSTATNTAKPRTTTKKLIVPMLNDGSQLQAWAISKGLPEAEVGMSSTQYYRLLCNAVERRKQAKAKGNLLD